MELKHSSLPEDKFKEKIILSFLLVSIIFANVIKPYLFDNLICFNCLALDSKIF